MPAIGTKTLADHWGVTTGYVRQLRMPDRATRGLALLPAFEDLGELHPARFAAADAWRETHVPARKPRPSGPAAVVPDAADTRNLDGEEGGGSATVDTSEFLVPTEDFDGWVIEQAEQVVKIQIGLYQRASRTGDEYKIRKALENWDAAASRCADLRKRFLELRARATGMISIDRAQDIVGRELGLLQQLLDDLGARVGSVIGALGEISSASVTTAVNAEIDKIYAQLANTRTATAAANATVEQQVA